MKIIAFILTSFFFINSSHAKLNFASEDMKKYSSHQLTWWGFKIYIAEVWTPKSQKPDLSEPIILHINYQKNIKAEKLISTTQDEWKRLGLINAKSPEWIKQLSKIWPDIKSGDTITTYSDGQATYFYQGKKLLGSVNDESFAKPFLLIWLHEKSKTSELLKRSN